MGLSRSVDGNSRVFNSRKTTRFRLEAGSAALPIQADLAKKPLQPNT